MKRCAACLALYFCGAAQDQPVVRVTTRLVEIHVVASDRRGRPVTDLTKDDFVLKDRGKVQQLRFFSMETGRADASASSPLPQGVYTNIAHGDARPHSATVVLFDRLNTAIPDQNYARDELVKFLRRAGPDEPIALFSLDSELRPVWGFAADSQLRTEMADGAGSRASGMLRAGDVPRGPQPGDRTTRLDRAEEKMKEFDKRVAELSTIVRVDHTLQALDAIAGYLAHFPGRKNLVWISGSFPLAIGYEAEKIMDWRTVRRDFSGRVGRTARALTDANVAVFPVDARGLAGAQMADTVSEWGFAADGSQIPQSVMSAHESMRLLADSTGGRAFRGGNDASIAIRQALDDSAVVYVLGYQPGDDNWDGRFRPVEVSVKREGVRVRYRRGYYAYRDEPEKTREAALLEACWSPMNATGINLIASAKSEGGGRLQVVTMVEARHITMESKDGRWLGTLDVLFVQQDAKGQNVSAVKSTLAMKLTDEQHQLNLANGARLIKVLDVAPSAVRLRIAVRDRPSGRVGSLAMPLGRE